MAPLYFPNLIQINYDLMLRMKWLWFMPNLMQILSIFLKLQAVKQCDPGFFGLPGMSWSSIFQRLTTLSEKKTWQRTSQLQRCLTSLNEWPQVLLSVCNLKNLVNGTGDSAILKTSMRSEWFLLSSRVHRFSLVFHVCVTDGFSH